MKRLLWILVIAGLAMAQDKQPPARGANVELTVYLLSGALQGTGTDDVPQDLSSTVKQLHSVFSYKSYKLAESFVLRGRSAGRKEVGGAQTQGILPGSGLHYDFGYTRVWLTPETPREVHIDGLRIILTSQTHLGRPADPVASLSTDLDLIEGQKTVVGKSSVNNAGDALILVIVPKVIE
jgi:hypothetical protein